MDGRGTSSLPISLDSQADVDAASASASASASANSIVSVVDKNTVIVTDDVSAHAVPGLDAAPRAVISGTGDSAGGWRKKRAQVTVELDEEREETGGGSVEGTRRRGRIDNADYEEPEREDVRTARQHESARDAQVIGGPLWSPRSSSVVASAAGALSSASNSTAMLFPAVPENQDITGEMVGKADSYAAHQQQQQQEQQQQVVLQQHHKQSYPHAQQQYRFSVLEEQLPQQQLELIQAGLAQLGGTATECERTVPPENRSSARLGLGPVIRLPPFPDPSRPQQRAFMYRSAAAAAASAGGGAFASADAAWLDRTLAEDPMMPHVPLVEGIFPFSEAYPLQHDYMSSVVRCLAMGGASALLESPTGTGKTICLLVACAAWLSTLESPTVRAKLKNLIDNREKALRTKFSEFISATYNKPEQGLVDSFAGGTAGWLAEQYAESLHRCTLLRRAIESPPRVFYTSRTHSQLQQVIRELKKKLRLGYPHVRSSVLGSRSQMCVNPDVMPTPNHNVSHTQVNTLCRIAVLQRTCSYHLGGSAPSSAVSERVASTVPEVWDIEDAQVLGRKHRFCPFFYSRDLAKLPTAYSSEFSDGNGTGVPGGGSGSGSGSDGAQQERTQQLRFPHFIFLPYNYLCDRNIRNNMKIDTRNQIVIFDEAHNVDGVCCDSASFELTVKDLQDALRDARACERALSAGMRAAPAEDHDEHQQPLTPTYVQKVMQIIEALQKSLASRFPAPLIGRGGETRQHPVESLTFDAAWLLGLLHSACNVTATTFRLVIALLQQMVDLLSEGAVGEEADQGPARNAQDSGLQKFMDFMRCVFEIPMQNFSLIKSDVAADDYVRHVLDDNFCIYLGPDDSQQQSTIRRQSFTVSAANQFKLCLWCMSPGLSLRDIITARSAQSFSSLLGQEAVETNKGVATFDHMHTHALIMTSGTLNPLNEFSADFGWRFEVQLENPHIINPDKQVLVGALRQGPGREKLNSNFENRKSRGYILDLGNSIVNLCRIIPHGVLCFFPSYGQMIYACDMWEQPQPELGGKSIMQSLRVLKEVFQEPTRSDALPEAMRAFDQAVRRAPQKQQPGIPTGGIFFAVLRGKVAEGLDFADEIGRAVIITGIPYPMKTDPKVVLHRQFNDMQRTRFQSAAVSGNELARNRPPPIGGDQWYETQASRAVNQAIGRVIRHRDDYGAILFADERFANKMQPPPGRPASSFLSRWLRPHGKIFSSFGPCQVSFANFFRAASANSIDCTARAQALVRTQSVENESIEKSTRAHKFLESVRSLFGPESRTWNDFRRHLMELHAQANGSDLSFVSGWVLKVARIFRSGLKRLDYEVADPLAQENKYYELCNEIATNFKNCEIPLSLLAGTWHDNDDYVDDESKPPSSAAVVSLSEVSDPSLEWVGSKSTLKRPSGGKVKYDIVTGQRLKDVTARPPKKQRASLFVDLAASSSRDSDSAPFDSAVPAPPPAVCAPARSPALTHALVTFPAPASGATGYVGDNADALSTTGVRPPVMCKTLESSSTAQTFDMYRTDGLRLNNSQPLVAEPSAISSTNSPGVQKCVVCLSRPMINPHAARCGHVCCHVCWEQALAVKLECPVCRERTRLKQLLRVFV